MKKLFEPEQLCLLRPGEVQETYSETLNQEVNIKELCITKLRFQNYNHSIVSSFERHWEDRDNSV